MKILASIILRKLDRFFLLFVSSFSSCPLSLPPLARPQPSSRLGGSTGSSFYIVYNFFPDGYCTPMKALYVGRRVGGEEAAGGGRDEGRAGGRRAKKKEAIKELRKEAELSGQEGAVQCGGSNVFI